LTGRFAELITDELGDLVILVELKKAVAEVAGHRDQQQADERPAGHEPPPIRVVGQAAVGSEVLPENHGGPGDVVNKDGQIRGNLYPAACNAVNAGKVGVHAIPRCSSLKAELQHLAWAPAHPTCAAPRFASEPRET